MAKTRPCIDFLITQKCNYRCEYCSQSKKFSDYLEEADEKTIEAFLKFISTLDKDFEITISGGEPLCHPKFFEVIEEIKKLGLKLSVVSNFSYPVETYKKIIDTMGENFVDLFVSFHSTQVKDFDAFLAKLKEVNSYKKEGTKFSVGSVLTDENVGLLQKLSDFTKKEGINFCPQHMRVKNSYVQYKKEAAEFLENNAKIEAGRILKTFGTLCQAGQKFLVIYQNGDAYRCYSSRFNAGHCFGNIKNKNFKISDKAFPCLNLKCTCPKPISYGMILYNQKDCFKAFWGGVRNAVFMPFLAYKNLKVIKAKLSQSAFLKERFK